MQRIDSSKILISTLTMALMAAPCPRSLGNMPSTAKVLSLHHGNSKVVFMVEESESGQIFLGILPFSPNTNFIPPIFPFSPHPFLSFHFIRPCAGLASKPLHYAQTLVLGASSDLIPWPTLGPEMSSGLLLLLLLF